jgi:hypothetical protein
MSEPEVQPTKPEENESEPKGMSLTLMYSLVALALLAAMGFAWMIVLPFANRR